MLICAVATLLLPLLGPGLVAPVGGEQGDGRRTLAVMEALDGADGEGDGEEGGDGEDPLLTFPEDSPAYDLDQPYFDYEESANVTALLGKTALLNCRVKNIGNKTLVEPPMQGHGSAGGGQFSAPTITFLNVVYY